jgi:TPP-dependent pyruvate/acetoin dehydrogenase alpha subunit
MKLKYRNLKAFEKKNKLFLNYSNKKKAIKIFNFIYLLYLIEDSLEKNYHKYNQIRFPFHFCHGQECVPAALYYLLKKKDYLFSHHRSHGYYLAKKCPPKKLFSELYGKSTGANGGVAGSQDISFSSNNFYSGAILTGSVSIAVGTALSIKIDKKKNVVVSAFGDAATDQGVFWESINYSSLHRLQILFICENNNLSVFSPQSVRQSGDSISEKVKKFGIRAIQIYGNDPLKVFNKIDYAIKYIKKNRKPFFIESFTYRAISHVGPLSDDPSGLKDTRDYKFWKSNSPLNNLKKILLKKKYISDFYLKKLHKITKKKIDNFFDYAEKSPYPNIKNLENINFDNNLSRQQKKLPLIIKNKVKLNQELKQAKGY